MKSKLVKYPYNVKKYRWDLFNMNKKFQYTWDKSLGPTYQTLKPFLDGTTTIDRTAYTQANDKYVLIDFNQPADGFTETDYTVTYDEPEDETEAFNTKSVYKVQPRIKRKYQYNKYSTSDIYEAGTYFVGHVEYWPADENNCFCNLRFPSDYDLGNSDDDVSAQLANTLMSFKLIDVMEDNGGRTYPEDNRVIIQNVANGLLNRLEHPELQCSALDKANGYMYQGTECKIINSKLIFTFSTRPVAQWTAGHRTDNTIPNVRLFGKEYIVDKTNILCPRLQISRGEIETIYWDYDIVALDESFTVHKNAVVVDWNNSDYLGNIRQHQQTPLYTNEAWGDFPRNANGVNWQVYNNSDIPVQQFTNDFTYDLETHQFVSPQPESSRYIRTYMESWMDHSVSPAMGMYQFNVQIVYQLQETVKNPTPSETAELYYTTQAEIDAVKASKYWHSDRTITEQWDNWTTTTGPYYITLDTFDVLNNNYKMTTELPTYDNTAVYTNHLDIYESAFVNMPADNTYRTGDDINYLAASSYLANNKLQKWNDYFRRHLFFDYLNNEYLAADIASHNIATCVNNTYDTTYRYIDNDLKFDSITVGMGQYYAGGNVGVRCNAFRLNYNNKDQYYTKVKTVSPSVVGAGWLPTKNAQPFGTFWYVAPLSPTKYEIEAEMDLALTDDLYYYCLTEENTVPTTIRINYDGAYYFYRTDRTTNIELNTDVLYDKSQWCSSNTITNYNIKHPSKYEVANALVAVSPSIKWIGDHDEDDILTVSASGQYHFTPGYITGTTTFTDKTYSMFVPTNFVLEEDSYVPEHYTWISYNQNSAQDYEEENYLIDGYMWNSIISPFCYLNRLKEDDSSLWGIDFRQVALPTGTYVNIKNQAVNFSVTVSDTNGIDYITNEDTLDEAWDEYFDPYIGTVFDPNNYTTVTSYNRHQYPDNGSVERYHYVIKKELTKFIEYSRGTTLNSVLFENDRYKYSYTDTDLCDRSYEGTICGTQSSTGEETIPNAVWRRWIGLYLGEAIPDASIAAADVISPSVLLTQPVYDKEVNTSETLKYGTVASASIMFTVNQPITIAKNYINNYLILYYDFENNDNYKMMGWFYVDTVEAIDENTSRIIAHDEVYKLNKYVDSFMNSLVGTSTLDATYRALLTYCDCQYDEHFPTINNGSFTLYNSYNTAKTTGIQVIHYIAQISPGFIEANTLGDVVLSNYAEKQYTMTTSAYTDLTYTPFNSDLLDKVKILINNTIKGQDAGSGEKAYYVDNSPLIATTVSAATLNALAESILDKYEDIPTYRAATVQLLTLPETSTGNILKIGDCINITTLGNETYKIIVMQMSIDETGITITSIGTETYPVEGNEITSEFVNLVNQLDNLDNTTTDIRADLTTAQTTLSGMITEVDTRLDAKIDALEVSLSNDIDAVDTRLSGEIDDVEDDVTALDNRLTAAEGDIDTLETTTSGFGVTVASNLASIILNGTTNNIATKDYVDTLVGPGANFATGTLSFSGTASGQVRDQTTSVMIITNATHTQGICIPMQYSLYMIVAIFNGSNWIAYYGTENGWTRSFVSGAKPQLTWD